MIWLIPAGLFVAFVAGVVLAYVYVGQEEYMKRLRMQAHITMLEARGLPPRVLEVWIKSKQGNHGIYLRSIDADLAINALALVAAGTRPFSEAGLAGVLTRTQIKQLRHELIVTGKAQWARGGRRQGIVFTDDGQRLLEACLQANVRTPTHAHPTTKRRPHPGVGEEGRGYA